MAALATKIDKAGIGSADQMRNFADRVRQLAYTERTGLHPVSPGHW
jgi:hypothetical protein